MTSRRWLRFIVPLAAAILVLTACSSPSTPPASSKLYVDPAAGLDTNPGTKAAPLKTIAGALKAYTTGKTIVLDAGTYDEISGETWAYSLPAGVVLQANTSGVVLASTTGAQGFDASADATLEGVTLKGFHDALAVSGGTLTLSHVTFDSNTKGIVLSSSANAALTDTVFQGTGAGADLTAASALTMTGGSVTGLTDVAFYADGSATLDLKQVQVKDTTSEVVEVRQSATATLTDCTIDNSSPQGAGGSSSLVAIDSSTLNVVTTNVGNAYGYAILTYAGTTTHVKGGTIYSNGYGGISATGDLTIDGTMITGNQSNGVDASGSIVSIANATIDNNVQDGIYYDGIGALKLRDTELKSNKIGVELAGSGGSADLGTLSDPGGNTLQSLSTGTGLYAMTWTNNGIYAIGDIWTPNVQGADASGMYPNALTGGPMSGQNITIGSGVGIAV